MFLRHRRHIHRSGLAVVIGASLVASALCGCGQEKAPWETVYPAKGKITYKGKPIANAEISFFPQDSSFPDTVRPRAKSSEDGTFALWTYERGDGAPAGSYKATVVRHQVVVANGAVGAKPNDLPRKYSRPDTTNLLVEIGQGETEIPTWELQ